MWSFRSASKEAQALSSLIERHGPLHDLLYYAVTALTGGDRAYTSRKDITFSGHNALLLESEYNDVYDAHYGDLAISLDSNTIAVILVSIDKNRTRNNEDAVLFDGRPWDIIKNITVT